MSEFEKRFKKNHCQKTIGYLNNSDAYNAGLREGWLEALKWARLVELHTIVKEIADVELEEEK